MNKHTLEQAADWFDQQDSISTAQQQEFAQWLSTPENAAAFNKICALMQSPELTTALRINGKDSRQEAAPQPKNDNAKDKEPAQTFKLYRFSSMGLAASVACVAIFTSIFILRQNTPDESMVLTTAPQEIYQQQIQAPIGARSSQVLQDGTQLHLNADSAIRIEQTQTSRYAVMQQGQIYFDVAKDTARPFVIDIGDIQIRVLGTAFDIDHTDTVTGNQNQIQTLITVYEGHVEVRTDEVYSLTKGQQILVENGQVSKLQSTELPMLPHWRSGWLEADQLPLQEIVAHIQRYIEKPIVIASEDLFKLKISGRFSLEQPEQTLDLIGTAQQFSVTHEAQTIILGY